MQTIAFTTRYSEPFIKATLETFTSMVNLGTQQGEVRARSSIALVQDVSASISLSGGIMGTVALGFAYSTAFAVAEAFLGEKPESEKLMGDTIGELVNIISGFARKDLPEVAFDFSLPSVVIGDKHEISSHGDEQKIVVFFDCPHGQFHLALYLDSMSQLPD